MSPSSKTLLQASPNGVLLAAPVISIYVDFDESLQSAPSPTTASLVAEEREVLASIQGLEFVVIHLLNVLCFASVP